MAYRKKTFFRKITKRRTYKRKVARKPKFSIRKYVQREIARNVENKTVQTVNLNRALYSTPSTQFVTENTFQVSPNAVTMPINQGTAQGDRIGNVIKTKKLTFKGTIVPLGTSETNPNPKPLQIRMIIFYDKESPNSVPNVSSDLYQLGGSESGPRNDLVDMWAPFNTDRYTVLAQKTMKLGFAQYDPALAAAAGFWSNNDFKMNQNFSFDLTKHYLKMVKFNDNNANPTTRGLFCTIILTWANGGAMPA